MHCAKCLISKMPLIAQVQMCTQLHSKSTQSSVFPSTRRLMLCHCNSEILETPLLVSAKCLISKKNLKWCASCFVTVITGSFFSAAWGDGRQVACARLFLQTTRNSQVPQIRLGMFGNKWHLMFCSTPGCIISFTWHSVYFWPKKSNGSGPAVIFQWIQSKWLCDSFKNYCWRGAVRFSWPKIDRVLGVQHQHHLLLQHP